MDSISIKIIANPFSLKKINDDFTLCRCYVMALGKNRNRTYFSKDAVEQALPTLPYSPVVANLCYDEKNDKYFVGGHDRSFEDGKIVDLTVPYGVVIDDTFSYEDVPESTGSVGTYLTCSVILWTGRYGEIMDAIYSDDIYFGQSMEICPKMTAPLPDDPSYTDIKEFTFSCLTLLGKSDDPEYHTEPCFPSAGVMPFAMDEQFKQMFADMQAEIKKLGFSCNAKKEETMDEKLKILARFGLTQENVGFSIEEMTATELESKLEAQKQFALNLIDQLNEIRGELYKHTVDTDWGKMPRYYLIDVQDDEAIVEDYEEGYKVFGIPFTMNGDAIALNYECKKRKKCKYEDFIDSSAIQFEFDSTESIVKHYADQIGAYTTQISDLTSKLEAASAFEVQLSDLQKEFNTMKVDYDAMVAADTEAKAAAAKAAYESERDAILGKFEADLSGVAEFESLRTVEGAEMSAIEDKCFAMLGRKKFSYVPSAPTDSGTGANVKFGLSGTSKSTPADPYNGLREKYLNK